MGGAVPVQEVSSSQETAQQNTAQLTQQSPIQNQQQPIKQSSKDADWRLAGVFGKQPNLKGLIVDRYGHSKTVLIDALSEYGQIITVTTFPKGETFDNQPFATDKKGII